MKIPKQAIELAMKSEWRKGQFLQDYSLEQGWFKFLSESGDSQFQLSWQEIALSPTFWRSLENATGKTARAMYLDFCSAVWDADTDGFWAKMKL